jgi:glycosyltransferase involved in cell wall biosynthesis
VGKDACWSCIGITAQGRTDVARHFVVSQDGGGILQSVDQAALQGRSMRKSQLRVLFITPRFGTIERGAEIFTRELATRLAAAGHRVSILAARHPEQISGVSMIHVPIIGREAVERLLRTPRLVKLARNLRLGPYHVEALSLIWHARKKRRAIEPPDIVLPLGGIKIAQWARTTWPNARIVCSGQAGAALKEIRWADAFVGLVTTETAKAQAHYPSLFTMTIPNGVDLDRFTPAPSPAVQQHLLCVAALVREKEHRYLLDAFLRLAPEITLTCVGSGPELENLKRHPAYASGRIRFSSSHNSEMPSIYRTARAFTLPSTGEAFGIVFVEALASGLPIVAHDGVRQREVVGPDGYFVDVRDASAYAAALLKAVAAGPEPLWRKRALQFGWDEVTPRYIDFFQQIVEQNSEIEAAHQG